MDIFYVYQHIRLDENNIFYVGKGKNFRHSETSNRNKYWHNIVNKSGFRYEIVFDKLDEELALLVEMELIDKYRKLNYKLVNMTDGGEGVSGYKHTDETKKLLGEMNKHRDITDETRKKLSLIWKGKKRKPFTEEHLKKISEAAKKQKRVCFSEETKQKISSSNKGKKRTQEQREKISEATKLAMNEEVKQKLSAAQKGKKRSEETKQKISKSVKLIMDKKKMNVLKNG